MYRTRALHTHLLRLVLCLIVGAAFSVSALQGQGRGSLLVLADSGATVYVNGQYQGMIRSAQEGLEITGLTAGVCDVVLRRLGSESEVFKVGIKRGQRSTLEKRAIQLLPPPEAPMTPTQRPSSASRPESAGGVLGSERFVGLWREQREGTFGNAHFTIRLVGEKFFVQRVGDQYASDPLSATGMVERGGKRSFGVVKLEGRVRHYGGSIGMSLVIHAVVRDPMRDLNSDSLAVQYVDVVGGGAKFEGKPNGLWVRMKR